MPAYSVGSPCKSRDPSVKLGQCILIRVEVTLCPALPCLGRCPGTRHAHPSSNADAGGPGERAERADCVLRGRGGETAALQPGGAGGGSPPVAGGSRGWGGQGLLPHASPSTAPGDHHPLCCRKSHKSPEAGKVF